jgi:glycosyltransferase involved in cell wall biosynthesis
MRSPVKKNVLWLGFAIPDDTALEIFKIDPSPAIQTHKFGWSFVRALQSAFEKVTLVSSCPVQNFPLVPRIYFKYEILNAKNEQGLILGYINTILLKHITRFIACMTAASWLVHKKKIDWIFIHGLHSPYLLFGIIMRFFSVRTLVVLTDPPGILLETDGYISRKLKSFDSWILKMLVRRTDAVIGLAPNLSKHIAPNRPALNFPGILDSNFEFKIASNSLKNREVDPNRPFTIVYAGGLSEAYGVDRLVKAICGLDRKMKVSLRLFGRGEQEDQICVSAAHDSRIYYGGFLNSSDLIKELISADLLINPRPTHEYFSSHSFPSKLFDYFSVSRPILTTRIASIPHELQPYLYFIDDESASGIGYAIQSVMQIPRELRDKKAHDGLSFVRNNFSEAVIGKKISQFINHL